MTPIDWKLSLAADAVQGLDCCRHSLVTPIDWKQRLCWLFPGAIAVESSFFGDTYWLEIRYGESLDYKGSLLML